MQSLLFLLYYPYPSLPTHLPGTSLRPHPLQVYLALALDSTRTRASPSLSPGLLALAGTAWEKQQQQPIPSPGLALVSDPLGLGLPPGGLVLARVQGSTASAGLAQVLLRRLLVGSGQESSSPPQQGVGVGSGYGSLQCRQRVLVLAALERYVAISAHPCPNLILQVGWCTALSSIVSLSFILVRVLVSGLSVNDVTN